MQVENKQYAGLVADMLPNIRIMQTLGHFLHRFSSTAGFMKKIYSFTHLGLFLFQFGAMVHNLIQNTGDVNELTANTITVLHFAHTLTKFSYVAISNRNVYRTFNIWNQANTHPLFAESDARYHSIALAKMRKLLYTILILTCLTCTGWTGITFFGESIKGQWNKELNETEYVPIPRLPIKASYPFNQMSGIGYYASFIFQVYYLFFSMLACNLSDVMFCSWLIFACEQLQHLKGIMKPLMELSSTLDTYRPDSAQLFRSISAGSQKMLIDNEEKDSGTDLFRPKAEWGANFKAPANINNYNPNGLSKKQEVLVRSAIKYWVERHKHVVRLVSAIGDTYGAALLLHMLTSTICLTLLAYQATKIDGVNVYAFTTIGYLVYALGQVFHFCIYGNRLIEESSSVMEAAYCCHWYDGSEEAKTFVQIVCQQCQKAMSISGAKFFTVSLDLFASVLGAVVTYFMVLVQLK